jgi:hypothetical protein
VVLTRRERLVVECRHTTIAGTMFITLALAGRVRVCAAVAAYDAGRVTVSMIFAVWNLALDSAIAIKLFGLVTATARPATPLRVGARNKAYIIQKAA